MHQSLGQLAGRLLIQCRLAEAGIAAEVAAAHHTGIVLTGTSPEGVVRALRGRGFDGPVLCDVGRYSGARRVSARCGIRPAWCRRQHELGLTALTDSGYLRERDWIGLRTILLATEQQSAPTIALLAMAARWFAAPAVCAALSREINRHGVPVAFVVEHREDPFGVQYLLRGFLQVLRAVTVPVLLLRSDVSALGALCHGAHAAAIGSVSALRHFYPVESRGGRNVSGVSAFVPRLLSYHNLDTCEHVFATTPEVDQLWACECPICDGATPASLRNADDPVTAAFRHSLHVQLDRHEEIFSRPRTGEELTRIWHEACSHALHLHLLVAETIDRWRPPAGLRSWYKVTEAALLDSAHIPQQQTAGPSRRIHPVKGVNPGNLWR